MGPGLRVDLSHLGVSRAKLDTERVGQLSLSSCAAGNHRAVARPGLRAAVRGLASLWTDVPRRR
jgi:hypothetical protein